MCVCVCVWDSWSTHFCAKLWLWVLQQGPKIRWFILAYSWMYLDISLCTLTPCPCSRMKHEMCLSNRIKNCQHWTLFYTAAFQRKTVAPIQAFSFSHAVRWQWSNYINNFYYICNSLINDRPFWCTSYKIFNRRIIKNSSVHLLGLLLFCVYINVNWC